MLVCNYSSFSNVPTLRCRAKKLIKFNISMFNNYIVPPSIIDTTDHTTQLITPAKVQLSCTAEGYPLPDIRWRKISYDGTTELFFPNLQHPRISISQNMNVTSTSTTSIFTIGTSYANDSANYTCEAENKIRTILSNPLITHIHCK